MSLFAESSWETDAVGDKISKEFFKKAKKKGKKSVKKSQREAGALVSAAQYEEARRNVKAVAKSVKASKHEKLKAKKRRKSESLASEESTPKKSKKSKPTVQNTEAKTSKKSEKKKTVLDKQSDEKKKKVLDKQSDEKKNFVSSNEKSLLSKNDKTVIVKKARKRAGIAREEVDQTAPAESTNKETKSQRRRKKLKLKKIAENAGLGDATTRSSWPVKSTDDSPVKSLNVRRIEKLLALKEKRVSGKRNIVKEPETLRDRMMAQLRASRFRFLNETLYNNESSESKKYFKEDPDAFTAYHTGYRQQVEQWPLNPLDVVISAIKKMPKEYVVADFGCGEARLAESVLQKVHSFDLVAVNDKVKACDMAHTPLLINGVNVVVFCLSLMGTNLADYLLEANRVLKKDGILKIADIESRFENVDEFIKLLENYGFTNTWKDLSHNLFYFMDFKKVSEVNRKTKNLPEIVLKPCLYKKR